MNYPAFREQQHSRDRAGRFAPHQGAPQEGSLADGPRRDYTIAAPGGTVIAEVEHHDAVPGDRTWAEIEDEIGSDAKGRLYRVSNGLTGAANLIMGAYSAAQLDCDSEPGARTLLLDPGDSGYAPVRARLVMPGDRYGLEDRLVSGEDGGEGRYGPMIEFYDTRYDHDGWSGRGQFITRFYTGTLEEAGWTKADSSLGPSGSWKLSAANMGAARLWAMEETERRTPAGSFYPPDADQIDPPF